MVIRDLDPWGYRTVTLELFPTGSPSPLPASTTLAASMCARSRPAGWKSFTWTISVLLILRYSNNN